MQYRDFCKAMGYNEYISYESYKSFIHHMLRCSDSYAIPCFRCENYIEMYKKYLEYTSNKIVYDTISHTTSMFEVKDSNKESKYILYKSGNKYDFEYSGYEVGRNVEVIESGFFKRDIHYDGAFVHYYFNSEDSEKFNIFIRQNYDILHINCCNENTFRDDIKKIVFYIPRYDRCIENKFLFESGRTYLIVFDRYEAKVPVKCSYFKQISYPYPSDIYFSSSHWQCLVQRRRSIDLYKCQICGNMERSKLVTHHLTYDRLGHEDIDDVITVCKQCHTAIHKEHQKEKKKKNLENVLEKMKNFKKKD